jgi:hypothetical protein
LPLRLLLITVLFACVFSLPSADAVAQSAPSTAPTAPASNPSFARSDDGTAPFRSATSRPAKLMQDRRVKRWAKVFSWTVVLLLIFAFGAIALVIFSRRFKDYIIRPAEKPTQYVDVWQLHKLPPDSNEDQTRRPGGDGDDNHN